MPFQEIDVTKIINQKCNSDPKFKKAYQQASAELDLIAQIILTRKEKGMTQKDVADKTGLTQQMVSRIENRECSPNYRNLVKIVSALDAKIQLVSKR